MTQNKPKLTYFNLTGRGLPSRVAMFNAFGKDGWEDDRVELADWAKVKPTMKLGQVPVLTLPDGSEITQSDSICRWAGKQGKDPLYPADLVEGLKVDEFNAIIADILVKIPQNADPEEKKKAVEIYKEGFLKTALTLIESRIQGKFVLGEKLSTADLVFHAVQDLAKTGMLDAINTDYFAQWPKFAKHAAAVEDHELVKSYYAIYEKKA